MENPKKYCKFVGIIDEVFENRSYLSGTCFGIIITDGDMKSKLVELIAQERMVAIIPERNIKEVIDNEQK